MGTTTKRKGEDAIPEEPRKRPVMKAGDDGEEPILTSLASADAASDDQVAKLKQEINQLKQQVKSLKVDSNGSDGGSETPSKPDSTSSESDDGNTTPTAPAAELQQAKDIKNSEDVIKNLKNEVAKLRKELLDLKSSGSTPNKSSVGDVNTDKTSDSSDAASKAASGSKFGTPSFGTPSFGSKTFGASSFGTPSFGALSFDLMTKTTPTKQDDPSELTPPKASESTAATTAPITSTTTTTATSGSLFGANSRFGNAFQELLKKKSFLDDLESLANDSTNDETRQPKPQFKQVDLAPVEVKTGEENEDQLLKINSKLYELDITHIDSGWKERGEGALHVNEAKDKLSKRIVMRLVGVHKVILNYRITPQTEFIKGYSASIAPGKFVRFNLVDSTGKPVQYMLKFKDEKTRDMVVDLMLSNNS